MADLDAELGQFARSIVRVAAPSARMNSAYAAYDLAVALEVYRNNYRGNLHEALAGAYPVIKQLVGDEFFRGMAMRYIEQHPSQSANLHHYGDGLSKFIAQFEPVRELEYLPDVAELEWACHCAYFAADQKLFDFERLAQLPSEQHAMLVFSVHPAARVVRSKFPLYAIWQAHQPAAATDFNIDLGSGSSIALVSRKLDEIAVIEISAAEAEWLQQVQAGASLAHATSTVQQDHVFDLTATLFKLVSQNVLIDFSLEE